MVAYTAPVLSDRASRKGASRGPATGARELEPGERFAERYEVLDCVGQGAMGIVYRVLDHELGEQVALKLLSLASQASMVERFRREVRLARKITNRNVARIHDIGESDAVHFLTMEFVDGQSLEDALRNGPLEPQRAARIAIQIAAGLDAAHEVGIIHRDLKPANILLEPHSRAEERAVLTDFGIARALHDESRTHETGAVVGTPAYMAPEQVLSEPVDARTDVYALGLTLYEMLTGALPFLNSGDGPVAVALARCHWPPADPRTVGTVPDALADLVLRCLALAPAQRPARAGDVAAELTAWLSCGSGIVSRAAVASGLQATWVADPTASVAVRAVPTIATTSALGSAPRTVPFAPLPTLTCSLAVLPFRVRGNAEDGAIADGLQEDLIDALSRTRGLRVVSSGATAPFREERDPRRVGVELRVDSVVDGTLQRVGGLLRVTVRLLDAATGVQSWSERHEVGIEDALTLQEILSRRLAESLRVEITTTRPGDDVPAAAVELYLAARREMRTSDFSQWSNAVATLERALALAPQFRMAIGAHAIAVVRAWWSSADTDRPWSDAAQRSVARALAMAPELAESHFASAMLAMQRGEVGAAAADLGHALDIAPTFAEAQAFLGDLQCEAGRSREGVQRLQLALSLQADGWRSHGGLARAAALDGDRERARYHVAEMQRTRGERGVAVLSLSLRFAAWWGELDEVRTLVARHAGDRDPARGGLVAYGRCVLGELADLEPLRLVSRGTSNRRLIALVDQLAAEAYGVRGETELALHCLEEASRTALVDVEWLARCPALTSVRELPRFRELSERVRSRAAGIWALD